MARAGLTYFDQARVESCWHAAECGHATDPENCCNIAALLFVWLASRNPLG